MFQPKMPVLVDKIDNSLMKSYAALPERFYVIIDGKVVVAGDEGPHYYDLAALEAWIIQYNNNNSETQ